MPTKKTEKSQKIVKPGVSKPLAERGVTNPNDVKKGFLSRAEKQTVKEMAGNFSAEAIAKKLRRSPIQIKDEISKMTGVVEEDGLTLAQQLELRPEWRQFQKQFSAEELDEFKHQYVQIMSQMKDHSVYSTEEMQVFQVITLKIQIDRLLAQQKIALDDMAIARQELEYLRLEGQAADAAEIERFEELLATAQKINTECAGQYKIYSDKQDKMLNSLKATREQRVKNLENSKGSILGWLRAAMEEDQRRAMGEEAEMMRIASKKEKARLSKPHTYADGVIDQPIFTAETVVLEFQEEKVAATESENQDGET